MKALSNTPVHILCVDDHVDTGFLLKFALQRQGYQVTVSQSVQQALAYLQNQSFDLLMTDLKLTDGCGSALCREIRQEQPHLPIVMMSGNADLNNPELKQKTGADVYLTKPVELNQLIKTVQELLPPALLAAA